MSHSAHFRLTSRLSAARARCGRWRSDESGLAATEFAAVLAPFLLMVLGIMGSGLQFFTQNALEHGVEAAARQIRTGQAQTNSQILSDFKTALCASAGSFIKCDTAHLSVLVNSWADWASVQAPSCQTTGGALSSSTGVGTELVSKYSGGSGAVVLITVCYKYDLATGMPVYAPVKLADGSVLMQSSTAFRTEPYSQ